MDFVEKILALILSFSLVSPAIPEDFDAESITSGQTVTNEYVIIYPKGNTLADGLAQQVKDEIKKEMGITLAEKNDSTKENEKEILIGKTNRSDSNTAYKALDKNQWSITSRNSKIIIAGASNKALSDAVDYFTDKYVEEKDKITLSAVRDYTATSSLIDFKWTDGELYNVNFNGGYPRLYALKDGTMLMGYDGMYVARSTDNGRTWSNHVYASEGYDGTANANFFQTEDGTVYLGFRSTGNRADGSFYSSIQISYSTDNGKTWKHHSTVYENVEKSGEYKGVWEPHMGMMNGYLTCFYANDSTNVTTYQNIEYKQWDPAKKEWINRTIVCNGEKHKSRDGMPVWQQLSTGEYVCVIEGFDKSNSDRFAIKLTYSNDGRNWSEPVTVMSPKEKGSACAAPYIVELPTGQVVISCQTNERVNGQDRYSMSTVISDGTPVKYLTEKNFSEHDYPFYDSAATITSMWNGMYVHNNTVYAITISGNQGIRINRYNFKNQLKD